MFDDLFTQIANAALPSSRGDEIPDGEHVLALKAFYEKATESAGTILAADFVVVQSSSLTPGKDVGCGFFINGTLFVGHAVREKGRVRAFAQALLGIADQQQLAKEGAALLQRHQPGRGILVKCYAQRRAAKKKKDGTMGAAFTDLTWEHVGNQTPDAIRSTRAQIESRMASDQAQAQQPAFAAPAPTQAYPVAQPFGQPPQQAPAPTSPIQAQTGVVTGSLLGQLTRG